MRLTRYTDYSLRVLIHLALHEDRLCSIGEISHTYERAMFFAGKLIFERERWWDRLLHNETAYQIQRRLQFAGLPMVILPVRVLE